MFTYMLDNAHPISLLHSGPDPAQTSIAERPLLQRVLLDGSSEVGTGPSLLFKKLHESPSIEISAGEKENEL
jgi:hypothetical protein